MKRFILFAMAWSGVGIASGVEFHSPTRMTAENGVIRVESPGYAAPCFADIDGDGRKDLLVGQFNDGKIQVYKSRGDGKFAAGEWLEAEGAIAEVPGVW